MATQYRINLVVDDKLEQILAFFRARNPLLKDVDLIRLAVGESYTARIADLPIDYLTEEETQSVLTGMKDFEENDYKAYSDIDQMVKDIMSDKI